MFSFPLSLATFMDQLLIAEVAFYPPVQVEIAQTAGGEVLTHELGPQLWRGRITLDAMQDIEARDPEVLLDLLTPSGRFFWAYDSRRPCPLNDPTGSILGAATPTIDSLPNWRELTLAGLPAAYQLRRGDYLAFDYGSPSRRALHRVATSTVTANGAGVTPVFEVIPPIRSGALVGAAVTLVKAACKARLLPGQVDHGSTRSAVTEGMSFQFIQTLS